MRISRYREPESLKNARRNRLEIIKAGLNRREMLKYGLITGGGVLAFKNGLSQYASGKAWLKPMTSLCPGVRSNLFSFQFNVKSTYLSTI